MEPCPFRSSPGGGGYSGVTQCQVALPSGGAVVWRGWPSGTLPHLELWYGGSMAEVCIFSTETLPARLNHPARKP